MCQQSGLSELLAEEAGAKIIPCRVAVFLKIAKRSLALFEPGGRTIVNSLVEIRLRCGFGNLLSDVVVAGIVGKICTDIVS